MTLGGLLTANGLAYVLTLNKTITFDNIDLALALNEPIAAVLSPRSIATIAFFVVAIFIFGATRIGRDLIATGSDRKAAMISGVRVDRLLVASLRCPPRSPRSAARFSATVSLRPRPRD